MVRKLGKLGKLALSDEEVSRFGGHVEKIIGYFRTLQSVDLSGIEPTAHVVDIECYRRPDRPGETLKCLADKFPYLKYGFFQVPRVLPEGESPAEETFEDEPSDD